MDSLIRYHRMKGRDTLWQVGTDHAGISTQMVVTEKLLAQDISPSVLGRDRFVDKVWEWRDESGGLITQQLRQLGGSLDWDRERFTMDEGFSKAVLEVFVRLYEDGLIYRDKRLVNWDPKLETAISDLEVLNEERDSHLWHLRYPLADGELTAEGQNYVVVATTRPETMLGDTGVAVNPDDSRYENLIGKHVVLPLVERRIPIVADSHVDAEFGTGCLKVTPAHDFNDYEIGARHGLEVINVLTPKAYINENAPSRYVGLDRFDARDTVLADLEKLGLIERIEPLKNQVPIGERSGVVVEPYLTDQWFVDIKPLAIPAVEAVKSGRIQFVPKEWENVFFSWMDDIRDWTISRQQWWGHQIPAWYDDKGEVFVGRTIEEARAKAGLSDTVPLKRDPDVLETWFSSALWTFATLGWPDQTPDLKTYHPTQVLVTGHDIIFFWVARMIMLTLKFIGEVPFRDVYMHGLVLDAQGQKMSKTKGNGLDPLDIIHGISLEKLIEKRTANLPQPKMAPRIAKQTKKDFPDGIAAYGTDALRMTFAAIATRTRNYNFNMAQVAGYQNFCNKLWNAARFVLSNLPGDAELKPSETVLDVWIKTELNDLIRDSENAMRTYRFDLFASNVYHFTWHEFCDWYLEFTKPVLSSTNAEELAGSRHTLVYVLDRLLRVIHPIMPFITDALWRKLPPLTKNPPASIMLAEFPSTDHYHDASARDNVALLKEVITAIRKIRGERSISPSRSLTLHISASDDFQRRFEQQATLIRQLARIESFSWVQSPTQLPRGSIEKLTDFVIGIPFLDEQDEQLERNRVLKEHAKIEKELSKAASKLNNDNFVKRAPTEVVAKEREKAESLSSQLESVVRHLHQLGIEAK